MQLPFTTREFFDVFESYNTGIAIAQIIAYALGCITVILARKADLQRSRVIVALLALFWFWIGIFYHIMHFAQINPAARSFGAMFVAQGLIFLIAGCVYGKLRFSFKRRPIPLVGVVFIVYAMAIYPAIGALFGHMYPRCPVFGVAPCPTVIFTFGLLLWTSTPVPMYVLIIPFLWSLIGFSAALRLGVPQDYGMVVAGILGTILIILKNRRLRSCSGN